MSYADRFDQPPYAGERPWFELESQAGPDSPEVERLAPMSDSPVIAPFARDVIATPFPDRAADFRYNHSTQQSSVRWPALNIPSTYFASAESFAHALDAPDVLYVECDDPMRRECVQAAAADQLLGSHHSLALTLDLLCDSSTFCLAALSVLKDFAGAPDIKPALSIYAAATGFAYPSPSDFIRVMLCHLLMSATNDQLMLGVGGDAGVYVRPNATTLNSALSDSASSRYEAFRRVLGSSQSGLQFDILPPSQEQIGAHLRAASAPGARPYQLRWVQSSPDRRDMLAILRASPAPFGHQQLVSLASPIKGALLVGYVQEAFASAIKGLFHHSAPDHAFDIENAFLNPSLEIMAPHNAALQSDKKRLADAYAARRAAQAKRWARVCELPEITNDQHVRLVAQYTPALVDVARRHRATEYAFHKIRSVLAEADLGVCLALRDVTMAGEGILVQPQPCDSNPPLALMRAIDLLGELAGTDHIVRYVIGGALERVKLIVFICQAAGRQVAVDLNTAEVQLGERLPSETSVLLMLDDAEGVNSD